MVKIQIPANNSQSLLQQSTLLYQEASGRKFPLLKYGDDTYFDAGCVISTSFVHYLPFHREGAHNILVGSHCSIAMNANFNVGNNHDYLAVNTGRISGRKGARFEPHYPNKAQIIIQNDVWLGEQVTIMGGVTVHDGAVVAANSHVVKDVPPYAIVGGNPAHIIRYRFSKDIIKKLLTIKWWNWTREQKIAADPWFDVTNNVEAFCERFYSEALAEQKNIPLLPNIDGLYGRRLYLYFLDFDEDFYLWKSVLRQFEEKHQEDPVAALLLIAPLEATEDAKQRVRTFIAANGFDKNANVFLTDDLADERAFFRSAYAFIANREYKTILRTEYCDDYDVKILSAVDNGLRPDESWDDVKRKE